MPRNQTPDLSEAELRRMLLERRRRDRIRRLEAFRKGGELDGLEAERAEPAGAEPLAGLRVHIDDNLRLSSNGDSPRRKWANRLLLFVELLAVLGLGYVLFNGLQLLGDLNSQVAAVFEEQAVEASPTPLVSAVVLPSGHTPPTSGGGAQPNEAEIPEHLRPSVQAYTAAIVVPTPGPEQAIAIQIESLQINAPVVQGDDWEALKRGVGQHIGSANPGERGNLVLSGHNDIYGEVFRHLDELAEGDEIVVFSQSQSYTYTVAWVDVVAPTAVEVIAPTEDAALTLISCYPYLVDTERIIVRAELVQD